MLHGDRWVRTPDCRANSDVEDEPVLGTADYVAMYWFADPVRESVAEWVELGETTREQGRRPELAWTRRRLTGFFRPLTGRVGSGGAVTAAAVPFRAHRGVVLEVLRVSESRDTEAGAALTGFHRGHLDRVGEVPGVTGSWVFAGRDVTLQEERMEPGALQLVVHWCEREPIDVLAAMPPPYRERGASTVLRTPLETVRPWQWSWFDTASVPPARTLTHGAWLSPCCGLTVGTKTSAIRLRSRLSRAEAGSESSLGRLIQEPSVTERVDEDRDPPGGRTVFRSAGHRCPARDDSRCHCVDVGDCEVQRHRRPAGRVGGSYTSRVEWVRHHPVRLADCHLAVADATVVHEDRLVGDFGAQR